MHCFLLWLSGSLRGHESVDVVLVEDPSPAAATHVIVEAAVILRGPEPLLGLEGVQHRGGPGVVGASSEHRGERTSTISNHEELPGTIKEPGRTASRSRRSNVGKATHT